MVTEAVFEVPAGDTPKADRVAERIRELVLAGALAPGEALPRVRDPRWGEAGITHNTVHRAYRMLRAEGLVDTRSGTGTFVRGRLPARWEGTSVRVSLTVQQVGRLLLGQPVVVQAPAGAGLLEVAVRLMR